MKPPAKAPEATPAQQFSREIRAAIDSGAAADKLVLSLTLMDASKIKRDPTIAVEDVDFSSGQMRYLGVPVREGGVRASQLHMPGEAPEIVVAEEPPPKPKRKKAATKATKAAAAKADTAATA